MSHHLDPLHPADLTVVTSDLLVATPDLADPSLDPSVMRALQTLRTMLRVDAVFVAEVTERHKIARAIDRDDTFQVAIGDVVPLEQTWCRLVLEGRLPEFVPDVDALAESLPPETLPQVVQPPGIRGHVSTPITLADGRTYGTLCCISASPLPPDLAKSLQQLRQCARFVAQALQRGPAPA